jgi:hypothetical protein
MKVIFDTNSYRYIYDHFIKGKSEVDKNGYIGTLCNRELSTDKDKKLSFFVLCELIQHLPTTDPWRKDSFEMICFALSHASNKGTLAMAVPPEIEAYKQIVGEDHPVLIKALNNTVSLLFDICIMPHDLANVDKREADIKVIAKALDDYKNIFIDSYQEVLSKIYQLPEKEKAAKLKAIKNHDASVYNEIILSLVKHILSFIDKDKMPEQLDGTVFFKKYFIGTAVMIQFLNRAIRSDGKFNYEKNKNDIIDFLICHSLSLEDDAIFITGEEKILKAFDEVGLSDKCKHINQYLNELGLDQIPSIRTFEDVK